MLTESTFIVISQYIVQALLASVIILILRRFYIEYKNRYFQFWSWSWLALILSHIGSAISLRNVFVLPLDDPFRIAISAFTICTGIIQVFWLYAGSYELSTEKTLNKKKALLLSLAAVPISFVLVLAFISDPEAASIRVLLRVGVKSLISGIAFIISALLIFKLRNTGIGARFIIVAFLLYGLEQFNYFISAYSFYQKIDYPFDFPYYMGVFDIFLQSMMGMGMIISMLEIERHQLKKANTELDTFLYRSSHDLRAPLTTISGIVSAIKLTDDPDKKEEFIDAIEERLSQADNVIRDIITLRKGQKTALALEEIDLKEEISREFNSLIDPTERHPRLIIKSDQEYRLTTDLARLHTILTNILSNSIKYHDYSRKEPFIQVKIHKADQGLELQITDNGTGITEKHLPKIFDMFYRANKSSSGTGLGLYLVKDALNHIGGSIGVSSEIGKGTTFDIYLIDHSRNH